MNGALVGPGAGGDGLSRAVQLQFELDGAGLGLPADVGLSVRSEPIFAAKLQASRACSTRCRAPIHLRKRVHSFA